MLYLDHPCCETHDPCALSPEHPDDPARLVAIETAVACANLDLQRCPAPAATTAELELVHTAGHIESIVELCAAGGGSIDQDTLVGESSFRSAAHAAGGACRMVRALVAGEDAAGFCAVRPSGHHADRNQTMGFCLFNNVAIGAELAISELGLERVMIVDWDVHHGNGTAEIFRGRADVLFASIHQMPLYPGTGPLEDAGSGAGEGYTINLPVPPGSGEQLWLGLLEQVVLPAAAAFQPELVLVSAGFDAHAQDPLAECNLQTSSFVAMAARVHELAQAAGIPLGMVLEGGYNSRVLAECVCAILPALAGEMPPEASAASQPSPRPGSNLARAVAQIGRYWPIVAGA
jgi:acetoin utilization deacetylase AcuC-like enzyme